MTVGFIGLGRMGGNMCRNAIAKCGQEVLVYDLIDDAVEACVKVGGRAVSSVGELVAAADVIFTSLPKPENVEEIALGAEGIAALAKPGTVYIDLTTSSPELARRIAATLKEKGIEMLDAPVSGGPSGAEAGTLGVMVGGDEGVFAAHKQLIETFAGNVIHVGPIGSGLVVKLVNNLLGLVTVAAASEGLVLAKAAGVDPRKLDAAIRVSTGDSLAYRSLADRALSGDYTAAFALDLAYKDIHLALELADEVSVPTPMAAGTHNLMRMARGLGYGQEDPTAVVRVYETTQQLTIAEGA
ncbi:MAG: NAD(P)-dependent oxidoreductase [Actinobacteria bacterium]|nr:NAD(P)-dependent oxidoreductase [Actinomycetota bacterium]